MEIYMIQNDINNMVYIGQTNNSKHRWEQHVSAARRNPMQLINKAMNEYGINHFKYIILEKNLSKDEADVKEIYWIEKKKALYPYGYNVTIGGKGAKDTSGYYIGSKFKDPLILKEIREKIKTTNISFELIAKEYDVSPNVISGINIGKHYRDDKEEYPLRRKNYSKDLLKRLFYSLKYEQDKTMAQIAREYEIDMSQLSEINQGRAHRVDWQTYPIRKGKVYNPLYRCAEEIRNLLKSTDIPQKDIARKFNVSVSSVSAINKGRYYRDNKLSYPLRYNYQCYNGGRTALSPNEVCEIEDKLKNTNISMRSIAAEYEIALTTVMNLNIGSIKKYRKESLNYPLRKL